MSATSTESSIISASSGSPAPAAGAVAAFVLMLQDLSEALLQSSRPRGNLRNLRLDSSADRAWHRSAHGQRHPLSPPGQSLSSREAIHRKTPRGSHWASAHGRRPSLHTRDWHPRIRYLGRRRTDCLSHSATAFETAAAKPPDSILSRSVHRGEHSQRGKPQNKEPRRRKGAKKRREGKKKWKWGLRG